MPQDFGSRSIFVSPEGGLRYWNFTLENIDKSILAIVNKFIAKNDTVWDIGANVGYFSLAAAHVAGNNGHCLSVEPDNWLSQLLRKTARANPDLKIEVLSVAISNKAGIEKFNIANLSISTNYLDSTVGTTQTGGVRMKVLVPAFSLDELLSLYGHPPNFLKIDVETAEHLVFQGADKILSEVRPTIYCEVDGANQEFIKMKLLENSYTLLDGDNIDAGEVDYIPYNILAIPQEVY